MKTRDNLQKKKHKNTIMVIDDDVTESSSKMS